MLFGSWQIHQTQQSRILHFLLKERKKHVCLSKEKKKLEALRRFSLNHSGGETQISGHGRFISAMWEFSVFGALKLDKEVEVSSMCWVLGARGYWTKTSKFFWERCTSKSMYWHIWYADPSVSVQTNVACKRFRLHDVLCPGSSAELVKTKVGALESSLALLVEFQTWLMQRNSKEHLRHDLSHWWFNFCALSWYLYTVDSCHM